MDPMDTTPAYRRWNLMSSYHTCTCIHVNSLYNLVVGRNAVGIVGGAGMQTIYRSCHSESLADIANERAWESDYERAGLKRFNDSKKPLLQCTNGESIDSRVEVELLSVASGESMNCVVAATPTSEMDGL